MARLIKAKEIQTGDVLLIKLTSNTNVRHQAVVLGLTHAEPMGINAAVCLGGVWEDRQLVFKSEEYVVLMQRD